MKQKIINHSIRKISFAADELKPWTGDDENLITAYLALHDRETLLTAEGRELLKLAGDLNKQTEKARQRLMALKEKIATLSKLADRFIMVDPNRRTLVEKLNNRAESINAQLEVYYDGLNEISSAAAACQEKNSPFIDAVEDDTKWEKFDTIKNNYFHDYETRAIDIVSFDKDEEQFRDFASFRSDHHNGIIDSANHAIENYNTLLLEIEMQFGVWEELLKRLAVIRMIAENDSGQIFTSAN